MTTSRVASITLSAATVKLTMTTAVSSGWSTAVMALENVTMNPMTYCVRLAVMPSASGVATCSEARLIHVIDAWRLAMRMTFLRTWKTPATRRISAGNASSSQRRMLPTTVDVHSGGSMRETQPGPNRA